MTDHTPGPLEITVGETIMVLRKRRGWTQAQLAEGARISRNAVSMAERNIVSTTLGTLVKIFYVFGYTVHPRLTDKGIELSPIEKATREGDK